jgi:DNA modification methylase/ParB-like chromosome segregation protein Spo0J
MAELKLIDTDLLDDHPLNPRIVYRDDVIDAIVANLDGQWPQKHALSVRPTGKRFQILAGHTRKRAADKKGISKVWCWVDEIDDATAYMELVTSNSQGEQSALEIGRHARSWKAQKGRGSKGKGLREYANRIGNRFSEQYLGQLVIAADVLDSLDNTKVDLSILLDRAQHLAAIHALPPEHWQSMAEHLVKKSWSVDDTKDVVTKAKGFIEECPDAEYLQDWLSVSTCLQRYIETREFSPATVKRLVAQAVATESMILSYEVDHESFIREYREWLVEHAVAASWDLRQLKAKHQEIEAKLADAHSFEWIHGKWEDHAGELKNGSVSLLLTDPPYGTDYQSDYRLDRKRPRKHKRIDGDVPEEAIKNLEACLAAMMPKLKKDAHIFVFCHWSNEAEIRGAVVAAGYKVRGSLIWVKNNTGMGDPNTTFAPKHERIIHAVKGSPTLFERQADVLEFDRVKTDRHPTEKPVPLLSRLIEITTVESELVADPFGGVASTLAAARDSGRVAWGCEMDQAYWEAGNARLGN